MEVCVVESPDSGFEFRFHSQNISTTEDGAKILFNPQSHQPANTGLNADPSQSSFSKRNGSPPPSLWDTLSLRQQEAQPGTHLQAASQPEACQSSAGRHLSSTTLLSVYRSTSINSSLNVKSFYSTFHI